MSRKINLKNVSEKCYITSLGLELGKVLINPKLNVCREIGSLLNFFTFFVWVACWCCQLAPRWRHFGPARLPPEWCHYLLTLGITNLSLYKHCQSLMSLAFLIMFAFVNICVFDVNEPETVVMFCEIENNIILTSSLFYLAYNAQLFLGHLSLGRWMFGSMLWRHC